LVGTFLQWQDLGFSIKGRPAGVAPGEWGCKTVFYKPIKKLVADDSSGDAGERHYAVLKTSTVFNADQVQGEGIEKFLVDDSGEVGIEPTTFAPADELIAATGAEIRHGGDQAFYRRPVGNWPHHNDGDYIAIPTQHRFERLGAYYETLLHELAHWSEVRLGWEGSYAMGELIAEMSGCFLASELGVPQGEDLANHAAYLKNWLDAMKGDASFIFKASTQASKVTEFLLGFVQSNQLGELQNAQAAN
jgi:antirestriction protein ArdC